MSTEQAFRDHEMRLMNPPVAELPDEPCDRCHRDLDDDYATRVRDPRYPSHWSYYCSDCAERTERCDQCGFLRCVCES